MTREATRILATILVVFAASSLSGPGHGQAQHAQPGARVHAFALNDLDGNLVTSSSLDGRVWFLTFVAAHQKRSERAVDDLAELASSRRAAGHVVDLLIVISGGEGREFFRARQDRLPPYSKILLDPDDELWAGLGVLVTPTSVLVDAEGTIRWFRAGHSFDYAMVARTHLDRALGFAGDPASTKGQPERPPNIDDTPERAWRHLRMGRVLARRGELTSAIAELRTACDLTPDAFAARAELANLLCRDGQADAALAVAETLRPSIRSEQAQVAMITGWAHRQRGDADQAMTRLSDAVRLDPGSERALYELGRLYDKQGDCPRALELYRRALEATLGQ